MSWHSRTHEDPAALWLREQVIETSKPALQLVSVAGMEGRVACEQKPTQLVVAVC